MPRSIGNTSDLRQDSKTAITGKHTIICPRCNKVTQQVLNTESSVQAFICSFCKLKYTSVLALIRSKKSHYAYSDWGPRIYSVRVKLAEGGEEEYQFKSTKGDDLDMHAKDVAVFSLYKGGIKLVQNMTIGKYMILEAVSDHSFTWKALIFLVVIIILAVIFYFANPF